jgi:putative Holliday junction resolvase
VLGLPPRLDGSDSETTRQVRNMAESLKRRTSLPVYLQEETLSTWDAQRRLREAGQKGRSLRARKDQAAAAAILETFLRERESGRCPEPHQGE